MPDSSTSLVITANNLSKIDYKEYFRPNGRVIISNRHSTKQMIIGLLKYVIKEGKLNARSDDELMEMTKEVMDIRLHVYKGLKSAGYYDKKLELKLDQYGNVLTRTDSRLEKIRFNKLDSLFSFVSLFFNFSC
jgi:hypothetical protein